MPNIIDNEDLYGHVQLGSMVSPGRATLSGHDREIDWDIKVGNGQSGSTTTLKAQKLAEPKVTLYLLKDIAQGIDDFAEWPDFLALARSTISGKTPKALDIYHPDLEQNGINSVVLKSVSGMTYDGKGGATVTITFLEYRPPKKIGGSPLGAKKNPEADPNAAAKAELAALTKQYQATPWG